LFAESIVDAVREPLLVLDGDLQVVSANQAFYSTFKVTREATEKRPIYELGGGQWNIPELRKILEEIISQNTEFTDFKVEHDFPGIGPKIMFLNARRLPAGGDRPNLILLAIEDVTGRG
jgi:PAS domain-containing protein